MDVMPTVNDNHDEEASPEPDFVVQFCYLYKKSCQSDVCIQCDQKPRRKYILTCRKAVLRNVEDNDLTAEYDEDASDCEYDSDGDLIVPHEVEYPAASTLTPMSDPAPHWHEKRLGDDGTKMWKNSLDTIDTIKRAIFTGAGEIGSGRFCDLSVAEFLFFDKKTEILIKREENQVVVSRVELAVLQSDFMLIPRISLQASQPPTELHSTFMAARFWSGVIELCTTWRWTKRLACVEQGCGRWSRTTKKFRMLRALEVSQAVSKYFPTPTVVRSTMNAKPSEVSQICFEKPGQQSERGWILQSGECEYPVVDMEV